MIKAVLKCIALVVWTAGWFVPAWFAKRFNNLEFRDYCMQTCSRGILWIVGIRLHVNGALAPDRPLLLVTNHLSYMDVPVIASHAPARFMPKSEIAGWPVIGTICRVTDCVFVERRADKIKDAASRSHTALDKGEVLSLFPESTTGNGVHLLPFKSSFFSLAEHKTDGRELMVQPAAITFTHIRQLPVDSTQWPMLAWYGDELLAPHFWQFLQLGQMDVVLEFLPPVKLSQFGDRKQLSSYCHQEIGTVIESLKHAPKYCVKRSWGHS